MLSFATLFDIYKKERFSQGLSHYLQKFSLAVQKEDEKEALYYAYVIGIFLDSKNLILTMIQGQNGRRNAALIRNWVREYKRYDELLVLAGSVVLLCRDLPYTHGEYKNAISQHVASPIMKAKIPDRAYDMHTAAGKRMGRGFSHFFKKAASLKNERFPNNWEDAGINAYLLAEKEGLGKASKIIGAIQRKLWKKQKIRTF